MITTARTAKRERILAVDDNPQNLVVLEELLGEDYELRTLDSGRAALDTMRAFRPDLVLLDIMMPDANGCDLCRQIRADPALRSTKVILVSARSKPEERVQGYEAGADDYVTKPFVLEEFGAKVRVHLRLKSAEELNELKGEFLTLVSHETSTPLSGIIAAGQLMASRGDLAADQRVYLAEIIVDSARRMHRLLQRVTLLSQLRAGRHQFERQAMDCVPLLESSIQSLAAAARNKGVVIRLRGEARAYTSSHADGLEQVFGAVLDNAIRFSPPEGVVAAEVIRNGASVIVTIADQGPGIDPKLLPRVWEGFHVEDLAHHSRGHGIGLALTWGILSALGGSIDIESAPGRGTRVTIELPAAEFPS